jgi:malonyl-CoA O-methyltransferase
VLAEAAVAAGPAAAAVVQHGAAPGGRPAGADAAWRRALAVDGFLMFSTLGPGHAAGLRELYRQQGWPPPMAPLVDMHDLGDMLVHAGFADPVMDQETLTLTWPTPKALLAELRAWAATCRSAAPAGLRTPRWRGRLLEGLEARRDAAAGCG